MLRRTSKTDRGHQRSGPPRLLVVEDHPEVARLLGKIFRREGYEVAEVGDHQVAVMTLIGESDPVAGVVISFSQAGAAACLKLLDALRNNPDPRIATVRVILVLDNPRQAMFSWQSGADEILFRPCHADDLTARVNGAMARRDDERSPYRRDQIERIKSDAVRPAAVDPAVVTGGVASFR